MAEGGDISLEELPKVDDDDNDDDNDETFYHSPNTSTSVDQGYLGYSEYMAERKRLQWEIKDEEKKPANIRERDEEFERRREAVQKLKRYFPKYNPDDATFNVTFGEDGSLIVRFSNRSNAAPHTVVDKYGNLKLEDLPKTMIKALGADYESMLNNYNISQEELGISNEVNRELNNALEESNKANRELNNALGEANEKISDLNSALQGLDSSSKAHQQEIAQYEEKLRRVALVIENQKAEKENMERDASEGKRLFDQTAKQNIELKIQREKVLEEIKLYKEEIDKYKKGKSNDVKLKQSNERLKSEIDKLKEQIRNKIISNEEQISDIESRKEEILKNLPLRERLKYIFKKYGFTVFAVLSAVGVVIGVIVSNLSKGLSTLGKGVGNGLKTLGKKLGEILPGMIGAIVSFLFKTAGQVIGFLGENAWLLIMAVVLYFVESIKKRK